MICAICERAIAKNDSFLVNGSLAAHFTCYLYQHPMAMPEIAEPQIINNPPKSNIRKVA